MWNLIFLLTGALLIFVLFITFFPKKVIDSTENVVFKALIITNCIEYLAEIPLQLLVRKYGIDMFAVDVFSKLYLLSLFTWYSFFSVYTFLICLNKDDETKYKKHFLIIKRINIVISIFGLMTILILPFSKFYDGEKMYIYGKAVDTFKLFAGGYMLVWVVLLFKNYNRLNDKKYIPMLFVLLLGLVSNIIQSKDPSVLIASMIGTVICYMMYFTIENPDVLMLQELYKNRKLIDKSNEDTSNFLFKMTQDIKRPVKDIVDITNEMLTTKDQKELNEGTKIINNKAKELEYLVNDALDVSSMSTKTLKVYDSRYNVRNLFKEIKFQTENRLTDSVKFEYSISNNMPEYVYGDSIKLKQAIYSILENSIENTKEGYISLDVSSIIKYDICRLIITVNDSGSGISIEEVNNILSLNIEELSQINLSKDKKILNLKEIKKLITFMGGSLIVKSDEEKGTTVSITIDQKIVESKNKEISKKMDLYEETLQKDKKIMVVDDDAKELSKITNYLENLNLNVNGSLFGRDLLEKVSNKHQFDLIILDDETDTISAYEVLKELKKNPKFNTPVVIMIDDNKEFIKLHYLQDGFADVIMKSKMIEELDRILKRF